MAAFRAHGIHLVHDLPRLSARQLLWLKDVAAGAALAVFIASIFVAL